MVRVADARELQRLDPSALAAATALVVSARTSVGAAILDRLPALEVVTSYGVGHDHLDLAATRARGVEVSNTPGVLDDCVADAAVGALLAVRRRLVEADRFVRAGRWASGEAFAVGSRSRVGILGLGRIGRTIARRLEAFDCDIRYFSRNPVADVSYEYVDSPVRLTAAVDSLIVAVPGGPTTDRLVGRDVLDALGPCGVLVNVARGSVVDEDALVPALEDGRLGGAALDTFRSEPRVPAALLAREDVVLLPHLGSGTEETRTAMDDLVLANLASWFAGRRLVTPVADAMATPCS